MVEWIMSTVRENLLHSVHLSNPYLTILKINIPLTRGNASDLGRGSRIEKGNKTLSRDKNTGGSQ